MKKFEQEIVIRWADCDQNRHVRHSAYYDYGAHIRIRYFNELGFSSAILSKLSIGPILFKEECSFIKELHPDDIITINLLKGEISEDASRWILHHEIFNHKGEKSAHITTKGAWMNLKIRKLTVPPLDIAKALHELPMGEEYTYKKNK